MPIMVAVKFIDSKFDKIFYVLLFCTQGLMNVTRDKNTTEAIELHKMLFNPYSLWTNGGLDSAIGSAINTPLAKSDQYFSQELTQKLFENTTPANSTPVVKTRKTAGLDLVSLNIQRGRDHGLPGYSVWRKYCHLPSADTWDEMEKLLDPISFKNIKTLYK